MRVQERERACGGFTLLEMLVAVVMSGILLVGVARIYETTIDHFSMQTQFAALHQNTQYAIDFMSNMVMQLGADMPDSGLALYQQSGSRTDSITVDVNPEGGVHFFAVPIPFAVQSIAVDDAHGFISPDGRALTIVKKPYDRRLAVSLYSIDLSYNSGSFHAGVDTTNDSIRLTTPVAFDINDAVYAYVQDNYYLQGNMLYHNADVLAENIDSLAITFYKVDGTTVATGWTDALAAEVCVRGKTSSLIHGYTDPVHHDGYRRLTLDIKFRLRNKA